MKNGNKCGILARCTELIFLYTKVVITRDRRISSCGSLVSEVRYADKKQNRFGSPRSSTKRQTDSTFFFFYTNKIDIESTDTHVKLLWRYRVSIIVIMLYDRVV